MISSWRRASQVDVDPALARNQLCIALIALGFPPREHTRLPTKRTKKNTLVPVWPMTRPATSSTDMPCTCTPSVSARGVRAAPNEMQQRLCWPAAHVSSKHLPNRHAIHGEEDVAGRDAAARVRGRAFGKGLHDARRHVTMTCTPVPQILSAADLSAASSSRAVACAGFFG